MAIYYAEKGAGLHAAIFAAGHSLWQVGMQWMSSDDVVVQAIIDSYTLDQAKAEKCALVLAHAAALRDKVIEMVSPGEMAAWPIKRAEADAFSADAATAKCPMLEKEALRRGISLLELVAKVLANAARFEYAETAIGGTDGAHRDAINKLATFEAVASYNYLTGWPEV
jgi:hypothetical protein